MTTSPSTSTPLPRPLPEFVANPNPEIYLSDNYIVFDFETTNLDKGSALQQGNRLLLACGRLGTGHPSYKEFKNGFAFWGDEFNQRELCRLIQSAGFIAGHNLKFEYQWLVRCGIELRTILGYDTMLGEYVLAGNRKWKLGLDDTAKRYGIKGKLRYASALIAGGVCPSTINPSLLEIYCKRDCKVTENVLRLQRRRLADTGLLAAQYSRCLVTPVLADIERNGMSLDESVVKEKHIEYTDKFNKASARFIAIAGGRNSRSPKQMGEFLYGEESEGNLAFSEVTDRFGTVQRTASGRPRTDGPTISSLECHTDRQREFKKACVALSKLKVPVHNLEKMQHVLANGCREVFARFNQSVTQTHRLSSTGAAISGFQFHNFDRAFKQCFRARSTGYKMVEADAPQLEWRTAGHLGGDSAVLNAVNTGEDVHALSSSILGVSRQGAKKHTFKPLYGGQSGTVREKAYYKAFREKYYQTYEEQKKWTMMVAGSPTGQLVTPWGLRFYWPQTRISRDGYVTNTPSIFNYPIQSLATADIIPLCLVMIWHRMKDWHSFIVNTIHDSVVAEVEDGELDSYKQVVINSFTKDIYTLLDRLYGMKFSIPLGVNLKVAPNWGDGTEEKYG